MQINLIERDIQDREDTLQRCKCNLRSLYNSSKAAESQRAIELIEQEIFYLQDQLDKYYSVISILKEEQGSCDEMLQKV